MCAANHPLGWDNRIGHSCDIIEKTHGGQGTINLQMKEAEYRLIEEGVCLTKIPESLKEKINTIPEKPGVYKMKDRAGHVMYVGKSKSLRGQGKVLFLRRPQAGKDKGNGVPHL